MPIKEKGNQHWANFNEISFVSGMRLLFWIYRLFGPWPFRIVLYPVLAWYVIVQSRARASSRNYLNLLNQYAKRQVPVGLVGVIRHFAEFAEMILDKMLLWGGLFDVRKVEYVGQEHIHQHLSLKKGALLVCTHMGNMELCRVLSNHFSEVKLTVLVHTKHAQSFNRMMVKLNPRSQLNLLQVTEISPATAILLAEKIAQGEVVVIAGDRIPVAHNPRVTLANFLGKPAAFPIGPYVLASVLRCPLYLLFSLKIDNVYQAHFELLSEKIILPRKDREQIFQNLAQKYADRIEYFCQRAPLQWFNFYDFWHLPNLESSDATS